MSPREPILADPPCLLPQPEETQILAVDMVGTHGLFQIASIISPVLVRCFQPSAELAAVLLPTTRSAYDPFQLI